MKYLKKLIPVLFLFFGIFIGFLIKNYPLIKFNNEIKIYEVLNLLLTATIGFSIPFFIKKWIEDSRQVKNNLIEELKDLLKEVERIKDKIKFCYSRDSISQDDKDEINFLFEQSDMKFNCLEEVLISTYDIETKTLRTDLKDFYINYWKFVTGAEVMNSKFVRLEEDFIRRHSESYSKFEIKIKQAINKIHRL